MMRTLSATPSRVLVIDDDPAVRAVLVATLASFGLAACEVADGAAGVALYAGHAAGPLPFALVVLDVQMPVLDGPATLTALQATDPALKCCFMSGDTGRYTRRELRGLGADWFLAKPFRHREVAAVLAAAGCGPAAGQSTGGKLTVLVVDADCDATDSLATLLRRCGHTVAVAASGSAALRSAACRRPDVVVYDLNLADMDGAGLSDGLRKLGGDRRPLLVSVGCTVGPRVEDAGADLYLLKPCDPAAFLGLLDRFARLIGPAGPSPTRPHTREPHAGRANWANN